MSREAARDAVRTHMETHGMSQRQLAHLAGVDPGTLRDFLSGARWPISATLTKLDAALHWEPGTIAGIARGTTVVSGAGHTDGVLLDMDESAYSDLTPSEREEAIAAAKLAFTRTAREIRRSREE